MTVCKMLYELWYHPKAEKAISKLKKKDPMLAEHLGKIILRVYENPEHFKPLRGQDAGKRRAHIGSFVVKFALRDNIIKILEFEHHDRAY